MKSGLTTSTHMQSCGLTAVFHVQIGHPTEILLTEKTQLLPPKKLYYGRSLSQRVICCSMYMLRPELGLQSRQTTLDIIATYSFLIT